ncbi:sugar fermentation stimulation protein [Desulfosporosinus acidiphilus SJ4]|uniref:Sugar fermentation stimulation protein homolog n=1 Tax=Desulfosporosinus acidiphilus (strain DSM 22704 / JCM 16185 / SJ4) TaxID=646529 RepID=I4D255_DESAJ|nr:DNA/RNA nuclease SfsA [Desulfosporosinus acidiphilus]AFM39879.1 sugar fermentation stimulation protein [Desulfosporosinus acidiphilus SJ4]
MKYTSIKTAEFISRPNRFTAHVIVDNHEEIVHVKNTGRCREILQTGTTVILQESKNEKRKTKYSIIAAYKEDVLINIDSLVPNMVVYQAIKEKKIEHIHDVTKLSREVVYGNSRFDLYFEANDKRGFIEVKGVTLENEGVALFPDAPTQRGCKHIYEMMNAVKEGYAGYIFFLIQLKGVKYFTPHEIRDPEFTKALRLAIANGVTVLAYDSLVFEDEIIIGDPVEVRL